MTDPALFQPDLCEQITPATVAVWIKKQAARAQRDGKDTLFRGLLLAAATVEKLINS